MFSGSKKLAYVALFTVIMIALVNLVWWLNYDRTQRLMDRQLSRRLSAVAQSGAVALKPTQIEELMRDDFDAYAEVTSLLEDIRSADSLSELFILDQNYHVLASTSLEADSVYFLTALNGKYIDSVFYSLNDNPVSTPSYRTGNVYLKTSFAPLHDTRGMVVAVLGVEANVDYFDALADLRHNLYYSTLLSIVAGIFLGGLFLLFQRRMSAAEQQIFLNETHSYLGRMVAVVSHEIKNPLMIIRASAERLHKKFSGDESRFIIEEVDRLNRIVTGYLDFAGGRTKFLDNDHAETVNLGELIDSLKKHFAARYRDDSIRWLPFEVDPSLNAEVYPRSLRQVLLNLLINGADACLAAGKHIEVGVEARRDNGRVELCVVDRGLGLTRKEIKRLFTPFYTTKQTGSGLGLFLSKKIIDEMDGNLDITSEKGKGTRVTISIPTKNMR
ncbi:MAG TPA: HAMP domain-containing sensor histidine kinase [candidate division Zixibacteria bacterium]|nr:HAMP domain-containing sensor histidine kinase [candidate division Zixibacteria bacterium]